MGALSKLALGTVGAAAIVVLFLVLRPGEADDTGAAPATETRIQTETEAGTETETEESPTTTGEDEPEPDPAPAGPRVIRLTVDSEEPEIARVEIERDERVVLVVRADVTDHVHLHGYNIMSDVAPGQPARIQFRATIPGRFEVELEDRAQQIAQLTVT